MLWSRLLFLSLVLTFSSRSILAEEPSGSLADACEKMLGLTLVSKDPLEFNPMAGMGMRGFLGSYPEPSAQNVARLSTQGVMWWGHSFAVKKTVEEAQAHDAQFHGLSKIMYLISDVDVSDLRDETPEDIVRERFERIFKAADMIYWDDTSAIISKSDAPPKLMRVHKLFSQRLVHPEMMGYFTLDDRGPRFTQSGWVFPKIRGELNYSTIFESGSGTIKDVLRNARRLAGRGYTFTFNTNFVEALNAARDQIRVEKNSEGQIVKVPANSRYLHEPETYASALEGYQAGQGFSVEVRDENGKLMAGALGERNGNIVKLETIFYGYDKRPDGSFRSQIDLAKIAVVAALKRLHEHGIDVVDAGMVTPFTASLKGAYVSARAFAGDIRSLRQRPSIAIDLSRPWTPE